MLVRRDTDSWPLVGDTPLTDRRLAQKNLAPFAVDLAVSSPDPNIIWKNFVVGDVFKFMRLQGRFDDRWGMHKFTINVNLPPEALRLYFAVPKRSFARWFRKNSIKGFKPADERSLHGIKAPFPEHVILRLAGSPRDHQAALDLIASQTKAPPCRGHHDKTSGRNSAEDATTDHKTKAEHSHPTEKRKMVGSLMRICHTTGHEKIQTSNRVNLHRRASALQLYSCSFGS